MSHRTAKRSNVLIVKGCVSLLLLLLVIAGNVLWAAETFLVAPSRSFYENDGYARQKLGELNAAVYAELPPPPEGAIQGDFWNNGGSGNTYYHGNYLYSSYDLDARPETIYTYYQPFFNSNDWQYSGSYSGAKIYFRETSCIELRAVYTEYAHRFDITIWHDYKNQEFSPEIPLLIEYGEFGETHFDTCPP
jgi:hypothetical protein